MKSATLFFAPLFLSAVVAAADFEVGLDSGAAGGGAAVDESGRDWMALTLEDCPDDYKRLFGGKLELGVGGEVERTAYKSYDLEWSVGPLVDFENDYLYVRNLDVGAKLINVKGDGHRARFLAALFAAYESFEFDPDHTGDRRLKRLDARRDSVYAGINLEWLTPIGFFEAKAARDLLGHGDGLFGRVAYTVQFNAGPVSFFPRLGVNWADNRYNDYYYGVGGRESRKSGLSTYTPVGSVTPFVGLAATLPLAPHWQLAANSEIARVPGTVRDSPMTDRMTTYAFGVKLGFTF